MKTKFFKSLLMIVIAAMLMVACERDERMSQGSDEEEEQAIESASVSEEASDDVLEVVGQIETHVANPAGRSNGNCPSVTKDTENKKIIVDFGEGCTGDDGRKRSGKIIIAYSHIVGDSLSNRIINFENYFVGRKQISGVIELRDVSINDSGNLQSTKKLVDLRITFANGEFVIFNGSRTRELISGYADGDASNNIYRITGSVSGQFTTGRSFTQEITTPIIANRVCASEGNFARVSGVVEMTRLNGYVSRKRIVDYGDGTCDNAITITTFRRSYVVTVRD